MPVRKPSFVAEFPLATSAADERALDVRLDAVRHIQNASQGEALRRLKSMRDSKDWQAARAMPRGEPKSAERKARSEAFKEAAVRFGFTSAAIQKFAEACRDACWIGDHLGSHDTQTTSLRAFRAVQQYAFGKRGRPRFKPRSRVNSVEGKGDAVIRLRHLESGRPVAMWAGLVLPLKLDPRDRDGWQADALSRRTKYVRIVRRTVRGRTRWYAQLVQEGFAPRKDWQKKVKGVVGLDLGPSTIAAVAEKDAVLETFCPSVEEPAAEIRRLQRAMDRSRRATNPDCFDPDGTFKKGEKIKVRSSRYRKTAGRKAEMERRLAAERRRSHGEFANRVLAQGNTIKLEKLSYRSFQKCFGRSVKRRAPGLFVSILARKAESAGAEVIEFPTRSTRLSQFSHDTGEYARKPLSQRFHAFADGTRVQRDLYSAWLARFVEGDRLEASSCVKRWTAAEPLLRRAASGFTQSASGTGFAHPRAPRGAGADRTSKRAGRKGDAADAVAAGASPAARAAESLSRASLSTPRL